MANELSTVQKNIYDMETNADGSQLSAREQLEHLFKNTPLPLHDVLFNIGLFTRSAVLSKFLTLHEVYQRFMHLPGLIVEFGTWWGQNLVLMENLRAIHEPFNKQRNIIGFDTFSGYAIPHSEKDKPSMVWQGDSYCTGENYQSYLAELLKTHEQSNVLGHLNGKHQLIAGDVSETAPAFFAKHPEKLIAFAYFDIGLYEPTKAAMLAIKPHLVPGSIILLDELTWPEAPGEALAFKEVFQDMRYSLEKCRYYPSKTLVTVHGK